jgi:hypothetical protein
MWTKKIDRKNLVLRVLRELYQNNQTSEIRRANLKNSCDDRLNQETNGRHEVFGGASFEWCLDKLEKQGLLTRVRKTSKETTIFPNKNKIDYILQCDELEASFDKADKKLIETNVEDSLLEEIIEEIYGKILDKVVEAKYNSKPPESFREIRHLITKTFANMLSRAFDLNVSFDPSSTSTMQPSKEFILAVVEPVMKLVEHNSESPFSITINYKGLSMPSMKVLPRYEPAFLQLNKDCFIGWVKATYNFTISEEDKRKLIDGKVQLLSKPALDYYGIFRDSILQYLSLLQSIGPLIY